MARTVEIDVEECLACESCVELCPEIFEIDGTEGKAVVLREVNEDEEEMVQDAIDTCPTECIEWSD